MPRALIVDDSPQIVSMMRRALRRGGFEVATAGSGAEALAVAAHQQFDVAVVDYQMPPPDGHAVLLELQRTQPDSVRILASGALDLSVTLGVVNDGAAMRVLAKPFDANALLRTVEEALASQRSLGRRLAGLVAADVERERRQLEDCLANDHVRLALQPIVSVADSTVFAFEGLLRSNHAVLDGPASVLDVAERVGELHAVGRVVAARAADWLRSLPGSTRLFVNLHPQELAEPERLRAQLAPLEPFASRVVLEVTERARAADVPDWEATARSLTKLGFELAVDDLGAGYSSLSTLTALHPRFLKLDMSLVRGIDTDEDKQRLVGLLCGYAASNGGQVIAEGIETGAEARAVARAGAHLLQGYYFRRPSLTLDGYVLSPNGTLRLLPPNAERPLRTQERVLRLA